MHDKHNRLSDDIDRLIASLQDLSPQEKRRKHQDVETMIRYYVGLTQSVEDRRNRVCDVTIQYLVVLVAVIGVLAGQRQGMPSWLYVMLMAAVVTQGIFSLYLMYRYEQQSGFRYPFLDYEFHGNQWKWFYRGNPFFQRLQQQGFISCRDPEQARTMYLEGLRDFVYRYSLESLDSDLASDIKQLYLMQVHNYYKNQFYLELVRLRYESMKWTIGVLLLTAITIWMA